MKDQIQIIIILFILSLHPIQLFSQNLVKDGSFEILKPNASYYDWYPLSYNYHTWLYHLVCFNQKYNLSVAGGNAINGKGVPKNYYGYQLARTGGGYVVTNGHCSVAQVFQITDGLQSNKQYCVRYFVSRVDIAACATDAVDGLLTKDSITLDYLVADTVCPNLKSGIGVIRDTARWVEISGQYLSNGSERYFAIGNFYGEKRTGYYIKEDHDSTIFHYGGIDNYYNNYRWNGPAYYLDDVAIWECGTPEYPADAGSDRQICLGEEVEIGAMEPRDEYMYLWSRRSWFGPRHQWDTIAITPKLTVNPAKTTTYYLWSIDFKFEHTYDSVTVYVDECNIDLKIPNVFTPNGDGFNDYFVIQNPNMVNYTMEVFNRWGSPVFVGNQNFFWDGSFNGEPAPPGAYFYVLKATTTDGTFTQEFHGSVTILR